VAFNDLFSRGAAGYAAWRPRYPAELFEWIAAHAPARRLAWDCATGNGQAATALAERFEHVIATDASAEQLRFAEQHPRVEYRQATAESSGLDDASVDAITVAQALHWFDHAAFNAEVHRVLVPAGLITVWSYGLTKISPAIDALIDRFYSVTLDGFWMPNRAHIEAGYRTIPFPFDEIEVPPFEMVDEYTMDDFCGYLGTWSAVQRYIAQRGSDPIPRLRYELEPLWGAPHERRLVRRPLAIRAGHLG
jgi:SAM-dependent methyltransferase